MEKLKQKTNKQSNKFVGGSWSMLGRRGKGGFESGVKKNRSNRKESQW